MSPCPRNIAPPSAKHRSITTIHCHCTIRWCREEVTCTPCTPMFSISSVKTPGSDSEQTTDSSEEAQAAQWQRRDRMQLTLPIVVHDSPWPAISVGVHRCNCDVTAIAIQNGTCQLRQEEEHRLSKPILGFRRRLTFSSFYSTVRHQIIYLHSSPAQVGLIVPRQGDRAFCRGPICLTRESGCDQFYGSIFCSLELVGVTRVNDRPSLFICVAKKLPMPLWPPRLRPPPLASQWTSTQL